MTRDIPQVSDGVIFRVLSNLLILDGERLSYRTLDVEQIGSVYEAVMGFSLEVAQGRSIAIKPTKSHGAPATVNLEALLATKPAERVKWLAEQTDQKFAGQAAEALKKAESLEDLLAALEKKIARYVTPNVVPKGAMILQPSDERRRSGSHYTPRSLTKPIVETTLRPVLEQLSQSPSPLRGEGRGEGPTPDQILDLKVCDPAMGSGAFLVETCRQLGDELVKAWHVHNCAPKLPPDEDEVLHARRLIAQRCLYGVDKNPMAVDLAKLSLWLATLAKDHPFTFLDHSLRCGDSLVGLTKKQIAGFHWQPREQQHLLQQDLQKQIAVATEARRKILAAGDDIPYEDRQRGLMVADEALDRIRHLGDLVVVAFFANDKPKLREQSLQGHLTLVQRVRGGAGRAEDVAEWLRIIGTLRRGDKPIEPFHWEIEFPEVFGESRGFDAIVGNPPFAGRNTLINGNRDGYLDWLKTIHEESHGNADLVAHFFRRAFNLVRPQGCFGLIATNTIGQGDTRSTGLRWICTNGGTIYAARKRLKWPGQAAVVVSVVHVCRGGMPGPFVLDGREVPIITAYLFHAGGHDDPEKLMVNQGKSFIGSYVLGMGFTFDDTDTSGVANPLSLMHELIAQDPRNSERILPYIGGEEVNDSPTHVHHRFVINFEDFPLSRRDLGANWCDADEQRRAKWRQASQVPLDYPDAVAEDWPELVQIIEEKVKPDRMTQGSIVNPIRWYRFARPASDFADAVRSLNLSQVLVTCRHQPKWGIAKMPSSSVFAESLVLFAVESSGWFGLLQSQTNETWARFFGSSMKDDLRYNPSDCFETLPVPAGMLKHAAGSSPKTDHGPLTTDNPQLTMLESAGREYYEFRAALMVRNNEGLTKTYNRFHDPHERSPDIAKLRELHAAMDRAVLDAYGWHDLTQTATCEFLLDYEDEEDDEQLTTDHGQRTSRRKKPWRYRWPDDFRDEVLARLLALNKERAEQEALAGKAAEAKAKPATRKRAPRKGNAGDDDRPLLK